MNANLLKLGLGVLLLLPSARLSAENVVLTLVPPREPVSAQAVIPIDLVGFNPSAAEAAFVAPVILNGRITFDGESSPVLLEAASVAPAIVAPGAFAVRRYHLVLPFEASGPALLEVWQEHTPSLRGVLELDTQIRTAARPDGPGSNPLIGRAPAESALQRTIAGRLGLHEPVYFLYGPDAPAAKFQFSFKYQLIDLSRANPDDWSSRSLQLGFTQRSLWDINSRSSPFYDTSYIPELFFESLTPMPDSNGSGFHWLGTQVGLRHESNGRDGESSRSVDTLYARAAFLLGRLDDWHLIIAPEVFTYLGGSDSNPGLEDYRGYGRLRVTIGRNGGLGVSFTGIAGAGFDHLTSQIDLTLPIRTPWPDFETFLHVQYFRGYGESLLAYDEESETVRVGIALVR